MSGLLSIGTQALSSNQTALSYTGQNIANVNTEGYSRQRVNFGTQDPPILGVQINDIQRITNEYLVRQVWSDQSAYAASEQKSGKIALLDQLMLSDSTSLSNSMDEFFTAMQSTVDDPLFIANRQLFLAEAQSMVDAFSDFDQRLRDQQKSINTEVGSLITGVNSVVENIAALNVKINLLSSTGQNYNSLIDERDQLIKELSGYMNVNVNSSDGGTTVTVTLGNGEPLVLAGRAARLSVRDGSPDPTQIEVYLSRGESNIEITEQLGEGSLGGVFEYRDQVLQPTIKEIGRLAIVFSQTLNEQHTKGMDLNGDMGQNLFTSQTTGIVTGADTNRRSGVSAQLSFYDVSSLQASDYSFEMTGSNSFRVTRLSDGSIFSSRDMQEVESLDQLGVDQTFQFEETIGSPSSKTVRLSMDGFTLVLSGTELPQSGDRFLLQPTQDGARKIDLAINNPRMLALASPLRVTPATTNTGNLEVDSIKVTDATAGSPLRLGTQTLPLQIKFNSDGTYTVLDLSDESNPIVYENPLGEPMENLTYREGQSIDLGSFSVTLVNQAKPSDRLTIAFNTDGFSDNRNALAMSELQQARTVDGFTYQDAYGQLLAKVGTQANTASTTFSANSAVLISSESALQSIAGVNLDEEATKLVQYQTAYIASTRLISTYQTIFDSLFQAVR